jgi:hypothetical protein
VVAEDAKDPLWWEIVEFDPGRTVRFRSVTGDVMQDLRFTFEPIAIGTHATYTFDCETTSRGWNLFLRASTFGWLYAMEGELRRISRGLAAQRLAENA